MQGDIVTGSWLPEVSTPIGLIPVEVTVTPYDEPIDITGLSGFGAGGLNPNGN